MKKAGFFPQLPQIFPPPNIHYWPEEGIALYWHNGDDRIEAYFDKDDHFFWIGKFQGIFVKGEDILWDDHIPKSFLDMLNRLFKGKTS